MNKTKRWLIAIIIIELLIISWLYSRIERLEADLMYQQLNPVNEMFIFSELNND